MSHTKGPWKVDPYREAMGGLTVSAADGMRVAFIETSNDREMDRADAQLISAAPAMLAYLRDLQAKAQRGISVLDPGGLAELIELATSK
jgi:hypothetical protein